MVFHWTLSDSKSSQVSRTRLSILTVFNNADNGQNTVKNSSESFFTVALADGFLLES